MSTRRRTDLLLPPMGKKHQRRFFTAQGYLLQISVVFIVTYRNKISKWWSSYPRKTGESGNKTLVGRRTCFSNGRFPALLWTFCNSVPQIWESSCFLPQITPYSKKRFVMIDCIQFLDSPKTTERYSMMPNLQNRINHSISIPIAFCWQLSIFLLSGDLEDNFLSRTYRHRNTTSVPTYLPLFPFPSIVALIPIPFFLCSFCFPRTCSAHTWSTQSSYDS